MDIKNKKGLKEARDQEFRGCKYLAKASDVQSLDLDGGWGNGQRAAALRIILIVLKGTLIACED